MPSSSQYDDVIPMKWTLLPALGMAWAWSQIAWAVSANALVKSNKQKVQIQQQIGSTAEVHFNTHDVRTTGIVLTAITALLAFGFTVFLSGFLIPGTRPIARKYLRFHAYLLFFVGSWLFATLIPFTYYVARHSVKITAYVNGVPVPQAIIDQVEKVSGINTRYNEIHYLKIVAILPWFTLLFTFVAAIVMWKAADQVAATVGRVSSYTTETSAVGQGELKRVPTGTANKT